MSEHDSFNPYREWLGLEAEGGELDFYRLLSLMPQEQDPQKIVQAAERAATRVRSARPGPHAARWAELLDRIAAAKRCLLDPEERASYDRRLAERTSDFAPSTPPTNLASSPPSSSPPATPVPATPLQTPAAGYTLPAASGGPAASHGSAPMAVPAPQPSSVSPAPVAAPVPSASSPPSTSTAGEGPAAGYGYPPSHGSPTPTPSAVPLPGASAWSTAANPPASPSGPGAADPMAPFDERSSSSSDGSVAPAWSGPSVNEQAMGAQAAAGGQPVPSVSPSNQVPVGMAVPVGTVAAGTPAPFSPAPSSAPTPPFPTSSSPEAGFSPSAGLPGMPETGPSGAAVRKPSATTLAARRARSGGATWTFAALGVLSIATVGIVLYVTLNRIDRVQQVARGGGGNVSTDRAPVAGGIPDEDRAAAQDAGGVAGPSARRTPAPASAAPAPTDAVPTATVSPAPVPTAPVPPTASPSAAAPSVSGEEPMESSGAGEVGEMSAPPTTGSAGGEAGGVPSEMVPELPESAEPSSSEPGEPRPADPAAASSASGSGASAPLETELAAGGGETMSKPGEEPAASERPVTREELERLGEALRTARVALGEQNFEVAEAELAKAKPLARLPEHQAKVERLEQLAHYVQGFWEAVKQAVSGFEGTEEFTVGSTVVVVVDTTPDSITIKFNGIRRRYPILQLPPGLAVALADQWFDQTKPENLVFKGAYVAVMRNADQEDLAKGRGWWQQAIAAGVDIRDLLPVYDDTYDLTGDLPAADAAPAEPAPSAEPRAN